MEVKTAAWGTVGLVIVAFGAVVIYAIEREGIRNDLTRAKNETGSLQSMVETRRKTLADRQEAYAALQDRLAAIMASTEKIRLQEAKNEKVVEQIAVLREEWAATRAAFAKEIERVRQNTREETVPQMVLTDGNELKAVRFKEMKDNIVVLEHTAGIAKVPLDNMPEDWVGRLALGWNPRLSAELSGKPDEPEPEAPVAAPVKTAEMAQQEHRESVKRASVTDAESKIRSLERKITETQNARAGHLAVAVEYDRKYALAQSKGNSSNHGVKRDEARKMASACDAQIKAIQNQISKLQEEIAEKSP